MALVSDGYKLVVQLVDNSGKSVSKTYNLNAATAAAAATDAAAIIAALDAVTMSVIKSYTIGEQFVEDALVLPGVAVQNENRAQVVIGIDGSPTKKWVTDIPAPVQNLFIDINGPGADIVNTTEASLVTYMNLFATAGVATVSDGENVEMPILSGKRIHRRNLNG